MTVHSTPPVSPQGLAALRVPQGTIKLSSTPGRIDPGLAAKPSAVQSRGPLPHAAAASVTRAPGRPRDTDRRTAVRRELGTIAAATGFDGTPSPALAIAACVAQTRYLLAALRPF